MLVVLLFVKEPSLPAAGEALAKPNRSRDKPGAAPAHGRRRGATSIATFVFSLAGSGDLFLLRRLTDLGLDTALVPLAWISLQLGKGLLNVPGGRASDGSGASACSRSPWLLYGATYVGFGLADIVGRRRGSGSASTRSTTGSPRAGNARCSPSSSPPRSAAAPSATSSPSRARACSSANVVFGFAYERAGALAAFAAAGVIALAASLLLTLLVPAPPRRAAA